MTLLSDIIETLLGNAAVMPTGNLIFEYFLPFTIVWVVFFALLEFIDVFKNRKVNLILALAIALMMTTTPYCAVLTRNIPNLGSTLAVTIFIIVFIFGLIMWGIRRGVSLASDDFGDVEGTKRRLRRKLEKLNHEYRSVDIHSEEARAIDREMEEIRMELRRLGRN